MVETTCSECGDELAERQVPVWAFSLWKWFGVHLELWLWGKDLYCVSCELERSREPEEQAYYAGVEHGWDQAIEHQQRWGD